MTDTFLVRCQEDFWYQRQLLIKRNWMGTCTNLSNCVHLLFKALFFHCIYVLQRPPCWSHDDEFKLHRRTAFRQTKLFTGWRNVEWFYIPSPRWPQVYKSMQFLKRYGAFSLQSSLPLWSLLIYQISCWFPFHVIRLQVWPITKSGSLSPSEWLSLRQCRMEFLYTRQPIHMCSRHLGTCWKSSVLVVSSSQGYQLPRNPRWYLFWFGYVSFRIFAILRNSLVNRKLWTSLLTVPLGRFWGSVLVWRVCLRAPAYLWRTFSLSSSSITVHSNFLHLWRVRFVISWG